MTHSNTTMSENKTITALYNGRNKQTVCLRQTNTLLTANHHFAYGKLLRTLLLVMITLGAHGAWGQPVEITMDVNGNGTIDDNEKKFYLIQTNAFPSFYIAPQENDNITTNNILGDYMLWYFLDAGVDGGTQYYYIVNNSTGKYICNTSDRLIKIVSLSDDNKEKCKFQLVVNNNNGTTDFYNINVKGRTDFYGLNKQSGSEAITNPIRLTNKQYINDTNSKWKFVAFNGTFTYPTPPFTPSNASETHYYEIHNVQKDPYYAATDATPDKVIFTDQANESRAWYFIEAASDTWYKYYYIINPSTGHKYMYYNGTADNTSEQTKAIDVKDYNSTNEDRYQFVVVQAARGDGNDRVTCYAIIPRLLIDNLWTSSSIGYAQASITNGLNMGIINSRGSTNGAHWKFDATEYTAVCATPVFVYDDVQQRFSITCATPEAKIYYKGYNEGEEVPTFTFPGDLGTLYTGPFDKGAYEYYVAVAVRCIDDGSDQSAPGYGNTESLKYKYHLIDKSHQDLLQIGSNDETLGLPEAYRSPLVTRYHYFTAANFNNTDNMPTGSEMTSLSDLGGGQDIYVTYDVSARIKLDGTQYYMLRYENPAGTELWEEVSDLPQGIPTNTKNKVYYPYTNGKEGFNLYGDEKKAAAFDDGESTRTRYLWYFEGDDPYRVKIRSFNTVGSSKYHLLDGPYASYFYTFYGNGGSTDTGHTDAAVHTVLTQTDRGDLTPEDPSDDLEPTEYMILNGHGGSSSSFPYRLLTTAKDGTTHKHLEVTTFDHQWLNSKKTAADALSGSRTANWYHMPNIGGFTKTHADHTNIYYETVAMGSDFQIELVTLYPVLHLVDNHGWEIAHWTMENTDASKNKIKQFNSPLVKEYRWYKGEANTGKNKPIVKVEGYYKYYINPEQAGSTPVATTADLTSDWLHVNFDNVADNYNFYVFYDAQDKYTNDNRYLVELNGKLAEASGTAIDYTANGSDYHTNGILKEGVSPTGTMQWKVAFNKGLDTENAYSGTYDYTNKPEPGKDEDRFDPYSLRIEPAAGGSYYTVNGSTYAISLTAGTATQFTYQDRADLQRDNRGTTFMAVQGTDGKMRLVLRNSDHAENLTRALDTDGTASVTAATTTAKQTALLVPLRQNLYTIVRSDGTQAISSLGYTSTLQVPADIASPLLDDTYYSFYPTLQDAIDKTNPLDNTAFATRLTGPVFVRYDGQTYNNTPIDLSGATAYTLRNGSQYLYYQSPVDPEDPEAPSFTTTTPTDEQLNDDKFFWTFTDDPYTVTIKRGDYTLPNAFVWLGTSGGGWHLVESTAAVDGQYNVLYNDGQGQSLLHREALGATTAADNIFVEQYQMQSYTYHIINRAGTEAIKCTVEQRDVTPLNYDNLPVAIRSPYIEDETLTFYSDAACTAAITTTGEATDGDIYVKYTTSRLGDKRLDLSGTSSYKMRVKGTYVYDNGTTLATGTPTDNWLLTGSDPYAVEIKSATGGHSIYYDTSGPSLSFSGTNKTFILLSGTSSTLVELMAATGADVATTYYNIGLDGGTFSLYSNTAHEQGDAALQVNFSKVDGTVVEIAFSSEMNANLDGHYKAVAGFTVDETIGTSGTPFTGEFDGDFQEISSATRPLFDTVDGAKIKNVIFGSVSIDVSGDVGAIVNVAIGSADDITSIYNCGILSGSVKGSGKVGGLVGCLGSTTDNDKCYARVINCYSYANIDGGADKGGIVGYNSYASTNADLHLRTMVMNCMFYGDIASGGNISPIYGGKIINNSDATGLNNFNYYCYENLTSTVTEGKFNCALGAEERFLTRFEFYRQILNSNLPLAAWYATGSAANYKDEMAKWVLESADRTIANPKRYPDLRRHGSGAFYPSIINIDAAHAGLAADPEGTDRNKGCRLGTLNVSITQGSGAPSGAHIIVPSRSLNITDKDEARYNFNYYKVQLPYYNDVGEGNYTDNRVVTGWKITSIEGGTPGTFKAEDSSEGYNFADRNCTNKDLYGTNGSNRVFSQGAYFDVPNGVTGITIEPCWAKAVYLADPCYDKTYTKDFSNNNGNASDITAMGTRYTNGDNYLINGSSQKVYTTMGNAITALGRPSGSSVYDYAVVLVGNYHHYYGGTSIVDDDKGFTIMSADLDFDNEPDNCFIYQHTNRQPVSPIRFDFLCWSGIGMAQKPSNSTRMPDIGIFKPRGWFEVTNTCLTQFHQFEYDCNTKNADQDGSPLILLGGIYEQIVSFKDDNGTPTHTKYIHLGSNAWFKMFNNGIHADKSFFTPHKPISVTGGDYDLFYLSGMFRPDATANEDHAECYISGGYFGEVAGAGMEKINGDVYWQIDHADIEAFYGGGINAAQPVQGDITTDITNSNVTTFCGGPKFGDMVTGKKVTTTASGCTFGQYFGAGYGGTSLNRIRKYNLTNSPNYNFNSWVSSYSRAYETSTKTTPNGTGGPTNNITVNAIATNYEYELFPYSGFADNNNVGRFYVNYASLSLATTRNVTSTLTGCKITGNFYGGGSLGKVDGDVTSTLTDCEVKGNAFGAGFSAAAPTVEVMAKTGFTTEPRYDGNSGFYIQGVYPTPVTYTWHQVSSVSAGNEFDETKKLIYTTEDMSTLGTVVGNVTLNIKGTTSVGCSVYGGGEESAVSGNVAVNMTAGTVAENVYGGGKGMADSFQCEKAMVGVNGDGVEHPDGGTTVTITGGTVNGSVYGGGEVGRVEKNTVVNIGAGDGTATAAASPVIKGNVFGAGKGLNTHGYAALVRGNATVTVQGNARVEHSVYGGGEIASVGKYTIAETAADAATHGVEIGMPYSLVSDNRGICTVTVRGYAEIGQDDMKMTAEGGPDDFGYVFGAGKGVLPYEGTDNEDNKPRRMKPDNTWEYYNATDYGEGYEAAYLKYIETLALTTKTHVTIDGTAFVKGSVYGGSENGHVQHDTEVYIKGNCQIGNGDGVNARYSEEQFVNPLTTTVTSGNALAECSHWPYGDPYLPYDKYDSTGGADHATDGHTFYGNVFGGGSGLYPYKKPDNTYEWQRTAGRVYGNTYVEITGGHILTSVYGGCELTDVGNGLTVEEGRGTCHVKMSGGTLGVPRTLEQIAAHPVTCYLFGAGKGDQRTRFNEWTNVGNVIVEINDSVSRPIIYGSVFGGGEDGHVLGNVYMHIKEMKSTGGPIIGTWGTSYVEGNIFGGGRGFGGSSLTAGVVSGNVTIDIQGGTMLGSIYGGGRLGSVGTYLAGETDTDHYGIMQPGDAHGNITINISGGTIGNNHEYLYNPGDADKAKIPNTTFDYRNHVLYTKGGNVFAGCMGRLDGLDGSLLPYWKDMAKAKSTVLTITGGTIKSNVYGGGELGTLSGGATISITGGSVGTKVGTGTKAYYYGSVYGGGKGSTDPRDAANIHIAGQVGGDVTVSLNEGLAGKDKGGIVHQIFGCNDMNGSPKGSVDVHVYATQNADATQIANTAAVEASGETPAVEAVENAKRLTHYDVEAVYGGGNLAAYMPTADNAKAKVTIDGCKFTSIRQVYGGGNAASVPATLVDINGTFEIDEVFGGGNGKDKLPDGSVNPGANVGYKDYSANETSTDASKGAATKELRVANYSYGTGEANLNIHGGTVHRVYGGSNTKGNVRISAVTMLEDESGCSFDVDEAYGGGKSAPMDAEAKLMMACIPGLKAAYGGAMDAEIEGNVELTITNGAYDRVFGGNNVSGFIHGTIKVNIEETGCKPIIIGQLYGGGNQAPYTAPWIDDSDHSQGRQDGPTLNVRSFTSIGDIYGGGYGESAKVTGDTYVNINVCEGAYKDGHTYSDGSTTASRTGNKTITFTEYKRVDNGDGTWGFKLDEEGERVTETKSIDVYLPPHTAGSIGGINTVFGGGNAAPVEGSTHVSIGTEIDNDVVFKSPLTKTVQTEGTDTPNDDSDDVYEERNTTNEERTHKVKGVDIRGNVFGGGNNAEVTGNTNVVIGKRKRKE